MYLKRLEIAGFKSFADRTVIEFNQGLTAVVGPNGSGKSNVTEAIRWVLGEQSAKNLRGGKMPDVIFAGSSSRSPLNLAEVTLVLDNEDKFLPIDYTEVSITRRLTRSGDSDFFINKQRCRLKDIVSLFMDSGLGRDSFSIISQGKVEAIFNSKPEDRRAIFEEAAGVLKYKNRKKEAQRRLGETSENLSRIQDIIYELDVQLTPLKEQSDVAFKYSELKERLTTLDVSMTITNIKKIKEQWEKSKDEMNFVLAELENKRVNMSHCEKNLAVLKHDRDVLEKSLDHSQQQLLEVVTQYEKCEADIKILEEKQRFKSQTAASRKEMFKELATDRQILIKEIKTLEDLKVELKSIESASQKKIKDVSAKVTQYSKSTKEQLEDMRRDYVDVMQQQTQVNNDLKHLEKQYHQETHQKTSEVSDYDDVAQEIANLEASYTDLETTYQEKQANVVSLVEQFQAKKILFKEYKQKETQLNNQLMEAMRILQQGQAKQKSLKDLQESYAGFYQGVKGILQAKDQLPGIIGVVAELIKIPGKYQTAIETALGASVQHIIVSNDKSAREAISYLKQHRLGRATFLPLTTIKARQVRQDILDVSQHVPGFLGVASDLVTCEPKVEPIIKNLLGVTLVTDSLDSANQLAKKINFQYRVVSLDGDVMNPGGSMTGGASKKGQSMHWFSQSKELQDIEKQLSQMSTLYEQKQKDVAALTLTLTQLEVELEQLREDVSAARLAEQELASNLQMMNQDLTQKQKEQRIKEYEQKELHHFLERYTKEKAQYEQEQKILEKKRQQLDEKMGQADLLETQNRVILESARSELSQLESELAVTKEKVRQNLVSLEDKTKQLNLLNQKEIEFSTQATTEAKESDQFDSLKEELMRTMSEWVKKREAIEADIFGKRENRETLSEEIRVEESVMESLAKDIAELTNQQTKFEIKQSRLDSILDNKLAYLQEEYHLTYEAGKEIATTVEDAEVAGQEIGMLKTKITQLGPINVTATAQYQEVKERYDFLVEQQTDLNQAKSELVSTMEEMDELVIKQFYDVFCDIREEFKEVFPKMFGGGHADLILTDELDLLHTGIDIVAQPPGKKLQQLSLLSGGERALTAIALLFAIIQARPVPFCILDEVEAALDEANVTRFGQYLRQFEDDTQFIVITHRKGTMEAADMLYGITMQESGVSKIVSVHLEELESESTSVN
ncbi:chromosome segregation protein SMC [Vagococcus jeotgali]|uniref:chromosome segregation protein SMC n=1 Tax=Vagococcus jeotgali TaxID=3109030 RepID=UPI002DDB55E0|nr:chromosome segregation protein SMC [Vagococcus sp. B2T-5]